MKNLLQDKKFVVIDDVISEWLQNEILKMLDSNTFDWYYYKNTVYPESHFFKKYKNVTNLIDTPQFVHRFFNIEEADKQEHTSPYLNIPLMLLNEFCLKKEVKLLRLIRAKANLMLPSKKSNVNTHSMPHKDQDTSHYVILYYVNDSDGDTFLFDDDGKTFARISPKKGRCLVFDGNILHASSNPIESEVRLIMNIDLAHEDNIYV